MIYRYILVLTAWLSALTVLGNPTSPEDAVFEVTINGTTSQNGFKLRNVAGVYTSLHGLLRAVNDPTDLKNADIAVKDRFKGSYQMTVDKIDVERDLVFLRFKTAPTKAILSQGIEFKRLSDYEMKNRCFSRPDIIVEYRYAMADGVKRTNNSKGKIGNCQRAILSLVADNGINTKDWGHFNLNLRHVLDKEIALDFTAGRKIDNGWSGAPILWQSDQSIAGLVTMRVDKEFGVGIQFDTVDLRPISEFLTVNTSGHSTLTSFFKGVKEWNASFFCNSDVVTAMPTDQKEDRYYDPCNSAQGSISEREKRKFKSGNFRKSFALAYSRHFDYSPNNKAIAFTNVFSSRSYEKYPEEMKGGTLSDMFLKVMYAEHNKSNSKNVDIEKSIKKLNEHYADLPITRSIGKKWKKANRHYKKDLKWWRKYGYDLDEEIKKYLRYHASKVACDSGLIQLDSLVLSQDYCSVHLLGQQLLINYCESVHAKRDTIGRILCRNLHTVDRIADSLITCALAAVDSGKLKCASNALLLAKGLMQCTDQYTYVDSIQMQLSIIEIMEDKRISEQAQYASNVVFGRVSEGLQQLRRNSVAINSLPTNLETQGNFLSYQNEALTFSYTYGPVDPSKYYLSAFHSGFPPAEYKTTESQEALENLTTMLLFIFNDSILGRVFPKTKVKISIEGFADGLRYRSKFKYRESDFGTSIYGDTVIFSASVHQSYGDLTTGIFADLVNNTIVKGNSKHDFGVAEGLGKNYALSHLRATHAYEYLKGRLELTPQNFERLSRVVSVTDVHGTHRRMQISVTLHPEQNLIDQLLEDEGTCPCDDLVERHGSALY